MGGLRDEDGVPLVLYICRGGDPKGLCAACAPHIKMVESQNVTPCHVWHEGCLPLALPTELLGDTNCMYGQCSVWSLAPVKLDTPDVGIT